MPIECPSGEKPRYRFRKIKKGKQRLAFCNNKVVETKTYKKGTPKTRHLRTSKKGKIFAAGRKTLSDIKKKLIRLDKIRRYEPLKEGNPPTFSQWSKGKTLPKSLEDQHELLMDKYAFETKRDYGRLGYAMVEKEEAKLIKKHNAKKYEARMMIMLGGKAPLWLSETIIAKTRKEARKKADERFEGQISFSGEPTIELVD